MNYRNMTNDELVNAAERLKHGPGPAGLSDYEQAADLMVELVARLEAAEAAQIDVLAELDERFPEIRDDEELSGGDAVARLSEWRCEL